MKVTGTMGIPIKAKYEGLIGELKPLLNDLTDREVWISEKPKKAILQKVGEE